MSITDGILYFHNDRLGPITTSGVNGSQTDYYNFVDDLYEFYNLARTKALVDAMHPPNFTLDQYDADDVAALWRVPTSFWRFTSAVGAVPTSPGDVANPAPWYRAADPASNEACGLVVIESTGDDASHQSRPTTQQGAIGASFGTSTLGARVITVRALAVGTTPRGADYMYRWAEDQLIRLGSNGPLNYRNIAYRLWKPNLDDVGDYADVNRWSAGGFVLGNDAASTTYPTIDRLSSAVPNIIQFTFTISVGEPVLMTLHSEPVAGGTPPQAFSLPAGSDVTVPVVNLGINGTAGVGQRTPTGVAGNMSLRNSSSPSGGSLISSLNLRCPQGSVLRANYATRSVDWFDPFSDALNPVVRDLAFADAAAVRRRRVYPARRFVQTGTESAFSMFLNRSTKATYLHVATPTTSSVRYAMVNAIGAPRGDEE